jgi:hypothetical protein
MAAKRKKVTVRVIGDGVQLKNGRWAHNGDEVAVSRSEAKELLAEGKAERV